MKEKENINMSQNESFHTCGRSHTLYTSPNTYSDPSKETVEEELGSLFLSVLERLEREGRLPELLESLNNLS